MPATHWVASLSLAHALLPKAAHGSVGPQKLAQWAHTFLGLQKSWPGS